MYADDHRFVKRRMTEQVNQIEQLKEKLDSIVEDLRDADTAGTVESRVRLLQAHGLVGAALQFVDDAIAKLPEPALRPSAGPLALVREPDLEEPYPLSPLASRSVDE